MMDQPDVWRVVGIEAVAVFQVQEEDLPLTAEAAGDVEPQTLNSGVMDTSDIAEQR